jgi:hypothetical protein
MHLGLQKGSTVAFLGKLFAAENASVGRLVLRGQCAECFSP